MEIIEPQLWAWRVFGRAQLGDSRRTCRLVRLAGVVAKHPSASLPKLFNEPGQLKAVYRLLRQRRVKLRAILRPVVNEAVVRCAGAKKVLLIADSSSLSYTRRATRGMGAINGDVGYGMLFHTVLAVDAADHQIAGAVALKTWVRKEHLGSTQERSRDRRERSRESERWGETMEEAVVALREGLEHPPELVLVTDREGDAFALYEDCRRQDCGFVIRIAQKNRKVDPDASDGALRLNEAIEQSPLQIETFVSVAGGARRKARKARLEVRAAPVSIVAPSGLREGLNPIDLNVVHLMETGAPRGSTPIEWWLATSEPIETEADVLAIVRMYEARWLIEELHMGIKTGCSLEDRQLQDRTPIEKMLVISIAIATELLRLRHLSRTSASRPATDVLSERRLQILRALQPKMPPNPTVHQALHWVANLGGFLMRKSDGDPGWRTLWDGYRDLLHAEDLAKKLVTCG